MVHIFVAFISNEKLKLCNDESTLLGYDMDSIILTFLLINKMCAK